ncbi:hypothetical protein BJX63DRAFT_431079 [Aspergillus granulosus]|uniref:Pyrroline-5-carboxylate reductase n=1 Tax=Aspergillus granulosus TaxID=176169 RepID=A0ABR4HHU7_9EURO
MPMRITFLGCGHIGKALLGAILPSVSQAGSPISVITVAVNRRESKVKLQSHFDNHLSVKFVSDQNVAAAKDADAVLFAFPPEMIHNVLASTGMKEALNQKRIISLLARTPSSEIKRLLRGDRDEDIALVRAMPTIGTEVHESATLISKATNPAEQQALDLATWIFSRVGKVFPVSDNYFDTATGMSAFCNALTTMSMQAITRQAVTKGVPEKDAIAIASQCIRGSTSLMLAGTSPEQLEESLSAPGSITGEAISRLKNELPDIVESEGAVLPARPGLTVLEAKMDPYSPINEAKSWGKS